MRLPQLADSSRALARALGRGRGPVGFVPTMGALHAGHLSLVRAALRQNPRVVVSVFVNPTQFGEAADFKSYPRDLDADRRLLAGAAAPGRALGPGRLLVFAPAVEEVYPDGFATTVKVGGALSRVLEARFRPGHFEGVATVVARLFGLVRPDRAYFGLKDYQQFLVVRRLCLDLALPVALVGCPTVRETDGLAMSSRNTRLHPAQRAMAPAVARALLKAAALAAGGELSCARLRKGGMAVLKKVPGLKVQYFAVADPDSLEPLARLAGPAVALAACVLGGVRLIDNLSIHPGRARSQPRPRTGS